MSEESGGARADVRADIEAEVAGLDKLPVEPAKASLPVATLAHGAQALRGRGERALESSDAPHAAECMRRCVLTPRRGSDLGDANVRRQVSAAESMSRSLPVTAIVASRDEAAGLERCLPGIRFCDEIIVIDLESSDETEAVARAHGAEVVTHPVVPIAEWARVAVAPTAAHEWLLFLDPDEEVPRACREEIERLFPTLADDVGVVYAPWQFHFGGRPLRGTVWGGENRKRFLVRRSGVELRPTIWGGTALRDGYRGLELPFTAETAIIHHWATGYRDWLRKHLRYLRLEPVDRSRRGEITGLGAIAATPWRSFRESFFDKHGYRDGVTGLALSVLWALFRTAGEIGLLRELRRRHDSRPGTD
jgi:hypothetical protein